jgi:O-antigen ligase
MNEFLKRNIQFVAMLAIWIIVGWFAAPAALPVVALSVVLLKRKDMYAELIIGFIVILMLSDSRQYQLDFAKKVKDVYLILLTVFYFFDSKKFSSKNAFFIPFIPFLIWGAVVVLRSPQMMVTMQKTLSYALLFMITPAYFYKAYKDKGPIFLKDFVYLITTLFAIGLILIVVKYEFVYLAGRYNGILGNPNGIGIFSTLFFILLTCSVIKFKDLFSRNELIVIYSILMFSVILSGSRNTLMSIMIFLIFTKFYKLSYWYGFAAVIVAAFLYQVVFSNLPTILEALGLAKALRADTIESGSGRMVAWMFAWDRLNSDVKMFLMGGGFSFDEYIFYANRHALSILGHQGGVHNTYLALWLNTGIIGLVLWLTGFFRIIFQAVRVSFTAFPIMYAVLFSCTFEAWLMGSLNPYTIMLLFVLTLITTDSHTFKDHESYNTTLDHPGALKKKPSDTEEANAG